MKQKISQLAESIEGVGFDPSESKVLGAIITNRDGITPQSIRALTGLSKSQVSLMADQLSSAKLITSARLPTCRGIIYYPTHDLVGLKESVFDEVLEAIRVL